MDVEAVATAVDELARLLRADGADLLLTSVDPKIDRIHLQLVVDGVSCDECVLPPDLLHDAVEHALRRHVRSEFELVLDDPRRDTATA